MRFQQHDLFLNNNENEGLQSLQVVHKECQACVAVAYVLVNLVESAFPVLSPQLRENYRIDQVGKELLKTALANGSA